MLMIEQVPFYNDVLVFGTTNGSDCKLLRSNHSVSKYYDSYFANDIVDNPSWWTEKSKVYETDDNALVIMKNYKIAKTKAFNLMKEELKSEINL